MPVNRGQGQTTRWYQLCFVPTSPDSSDDSDTESVVLPPSTPTPTSTTWYELSPPSPSPPPPLPPPNPEPQIDWRFPPPPPPPPHFVPPPNFLPSPPFRPLQSWAQATIFNIQLQHDRHQPPSPSHVFEAHRSDCTMDVMNGISRVRVSEIDKLSKCPICMDEFKVGDQACQLPCNHTYCSECILRWLNNSKTCPVCRLQLNNCGSVSTNGNNGLASQSEILPPPPPPPPPPPVVPNYLSWHWECFLQSFPGIPGTENSAGGNSDEADYDSACDELGDSQEDGASQSAPAPLT